MFFEPQENLPTENDVYSVPIETLLEGTNLPECIAFAKGILSKKPDKFFHETKAKAVAKIVEMLIEILSKKGYPFGKKDIIDIAGKLLNLHPMTVNNYLEFLNLPGEVRDMVVNEKIKPSDAMMIRSAQIDQRNHQRILTSDDRVELEKLIEELFRKIKKGELYDPNTKIYTVDLLTDCIRLRGAFIVSFLVNGLRYNLGRGMGSLDAAARAINDAIGMFTHTPFDPENDASFRRMLEKLASYRALGVHPVESTTRGKKNPRRQL